MAVLPTSFQIRPVPPEYVGDVTFEVVVAVAQAMGARTMESVAEGRTATWLVLPIENRDFYRRLEAELASAGLPAHVHASSRGLEIGG